MKCLICSLFILVSLEHHAQAEVNVIRNGTVEMSVGGALAVIPRFVTESSMEFFDKSKLLNFRLRGGYITEEMAQQDQLILNLKRAARYGLIGAGVIIATDGLVYLVSKGKYSLLGTLFSRFKADTEIYEFSEADYQAFMQLPPETQQRLLELNPQLRDLLRLYSISQEVPGTSVH